MQCELQITREPIDEAAWVQTRRLSPGMGAAVYFSGVVRVQEEGREIQAIEYEAFAACQFLIDEMKRVVPIWKKPLAAASLS